VVPVWYLCGGWAAVTHWGRQKAAIVPCHACSPDRAPPAALTCWYSAASILMLCARCASGGSLLPAVLRQATLYTRYSSEAQHSAVTGCR
jgi:hypothetical protein